MVFTTFNTLFQRNWFIYSVFFLFVVYGMTLGFPTIVIPAIQGGDGREPSDIVLNKDEISWFSKYTNIFMNKNKKKFFNYVMPCHTVPSIIVFKFICGLFSRFY